MAIAAVASATLATANQAEAKKPEMEKCYGIAKKAQNDCATSVHSCAALSPKDGDTTEWILVPKGLCDRIVGGSTTSSE